MILIHRIRHNLQVGIAPLVLCRWLLAGIGAVLLIVILTVNVIFWPIPYLGFNIDPRTGMIVTVEPASAAASAGLLAGDRVIELYNRPLNEVFSQFSTISLIDFNYQSVPVLIEHAGTVQTVDLPLQAPSAAFQMAKITNIILAMLCWLTGYFLLMTRRHEAVGSSLVACFWLVVSGVLGIYLFAWFSSYLLQLVLQWVVITILVPLAVFIHFWFPIRSVTHRQKSVARSVLVGNWVLSNTGLVALTVIWRPSLIDLVIRLSDILLVVVLGGLVGSGVILHHAYCHTTNAHVRRQIRLIAMSCFVVAVILFLLLVIPLLVRGRALIPDEWINIIFGIVPLAYLVGGVAPIRILYRIDGILLRLVIHLGTTALLIGLLTAITTIVALQGISVVLWMVVCFIVLYRPVQHVLFHLVPGKALLVQTYTALHTAAAKLTTTLEASVLIENICDGVRAAFSQPMLAFYLGDVEGSNNLTLKIQESMTPLPATIAAGTLTNQLCHLSGVTESRTLHTVLAQMELTSVEEQLLNHSEVVLWCPIRHTAGYLLGALLLGLRGDFDPYRPADMRELQRLMDAAALALANSATYVTNCRLHQRLQQERDRTAAEIARELHDEIININVRFNIKSLQRLIDRATEPELREELQLMLTSENALVQDLRMICEQLHPTGIDDPFGLASVLMIQIDQTQANWSGLCRFVVEGTPCPVTAQIQREALGITTEALTNALKHAEATEISVRLCYPSTPDDLIQLIIQDNGHTNQVITVKPGHWGVRGMQERAIVAGGMLQFCQEPNRGTMVIFTFPSTRVSDTAQHAL